ncbi:hypothetical protein [Kitasatospora sp. GAS204B]|uniref:hypothetical protein n=1 Tax=unclassified Kitasatospora TaxID=2633591 RepID=UPI00247443CF|nr:hypothetical protein [Kitasatospora sp. GAS204B]MDH6122405.1 hypothetical protein [Kitasatospora sp. GAS204B]
MTEVALQPRYWFVQPSQAEWAGGCVRALDPQMLQRHTLSRDCADILRVADAFQTVHPARRVVFFEDLTAWLERAGSSWAQLGTNWREGLAELRKVPAPALTITLDQATSSVTSAAQAGTRDTGSGPRNLSCAGPDALALIERELICYWSQYIRVLTSLGALTSH